MSQLDLIIIKSSFTLSNELDEIKKHFKQFLSYLADSERATIKNMRLHVYIKELDNENINNITEMSSLNKKIFEKVTTPAIASIGIFKKISQPEIPSIMTKTIHENKFFSFINYDISPSENVIEALVIAYLREFCNWLLVQTSNMGEEEHSDECLRTYDMNLPEGRRLSPIEEMKLLIKRRYENITFRFCGNCSQKIVKGLQNFASVDEESFKEIKTTSVVEKQPSTVQETGSISQEEISPHIDYSTAPQEPVKSFTPRSLTSKEKRRIKQIMLAVGVREPTYSDEYLEIRERFLDGKLSEHVFRQQAKRLAY
ncbi:MAG: hypothetical protein ACXAC7_20730 [Candidatus Hodarchaeales archaeon]